MKTCPIYPTLPRVTRGLLYGMCLSVLGPVAGSLDAADTSAPLLLAASKNKPEFTDFSAQPAPPPKAPPVAAPTAPAPTAPAPTTPANPSPALEEAKNKTLYAFTAQDLELKAALASFARANNLNIVPDNDVQGTVTLDVRELPLEQMMRALLDASDCSWHEEAGLIRVRNFETRMYNIDYLRLSRNSVGRSAATLGSGAIGGGGAGGMGGGGGGGMGGGGMGGGGGAGGGAGGTAFGGGSSTVNLTADNPVDFWKEMKEELDFILTDKGKATLAINRTAGLVQVTDRPSALKRVEQYLQGVEHSVHRQVEIEAKLYDVTLNDQFQFGIDWIHLAEAYGGAMAFGGATLPMANGGAQLGDSALGGINRIPLIGTALSTTPGANLTTLVFTNFNTAAAVNALQQQGNVEVLSTPRVRTLNNQTALIKVGEEVPFFNTTTSFLPGTTAGVSTPVQETVVSSITVGTILSITPQISGDDRISLDISPVLTTLKQVVSFGGLGGGGAGGGGGGGGGSGGGAGTSATAPDLDTKQAASIIRVKDGTTVVLGGLIQTQKAENHNKIPLIGDIPVLGKLFQGTFRFKQKKELVMFVTPRIVRDSTDNLPPPPPPRAEW